MEKEIAKLKKKETPESWFVYIVKGPISPGPCFPPRPGLWWWVTFPLLKMSISILGCYNKNKKGDKGDVKR